jgi:hypothetical protein
MKSFGFNLMQNLDGDGKDYLVYRPSDGRNDNIALIPLTTRDGILMLKIAKLKLKLTITSKSSVKERGWITFFILRPTSFVQS